MISALFAFLHFIAVFGIFAVVVLQWQTMSPAPTLAEAKRIQVSDRWFGMLAVGVSGGAAFMLALISAALIFLFIRIFGEDDLARPGDRVARRWRP